MEYLKRELLGEKIFENAKEIIEEYIDDFAKELFEEEVNKKVKETLESLMRYLYDEYKMRLRLEEEKRIKVIESKEFIYEPPEKTIYFRQGLLKSFEIFNEVLEELRQRFLKNE